MGNSGETHLPRTSKYWLFGAITGVRGATSLRHLQGQQSELRTPGVTPQGKTGGFGSPSNQRDSSDSLWQRRDSSVLRGTESEDKTGVRFGTCRSRGKRLEKSIIGRAKNVTLGKGGRREAGKHVSFTPLPAPPVEPWISSSWRQTAATHATPGGQHAHRRAHTHTHTPRRELHTADFCVTSRPQTPYLPDSCGLVQKSPSTIP